MLGLAPHTANVSLTITQETCAGSFIQAHQTQISYYPYRRPPRSTLDILCDFSLNLKANLNNLKGIGEDLRHQLDRLPKAPGSSYHLASSRRSTSQNLPRV